MVEDWTASYPRLEDTYKKDRRALSEKERERLVESFSRMTGDTLALSVSDDEFGTIPAIERLLSYFKNSRSTHLRVEPETLGHKEIGHFAFFNARFEHSLWRIPLVWLRDGEITEEVPGQIITVESHP